VEEKAGLISQGRQCKGLKDLRVGSWNVLSLYLSGALKMLLSQLDAYKMDITAVQEMRRTGEGIKSEIVHLESQKSITKWQQQWDDSNKGCVTKEYFPDVKKRLKKKINLTPSFTAMVTGHGMNKAYLHRFKITQSPEGVCANGDQTVCHLIFDYPKLENEREKLIAFTSREGDWPVRKCDLVNKYLNQFKQFTNSIDIEKL